ncbi:hypothetical protein F5B20DRAFT_563688 [Whalleya microplaca]|nr:hypothetical protein F5B20DRAFT_563688 [Whalleya microplaca]
MAHLDKDDLGVQLNEYNRINEWCIVSPDRSERSKTLVQRVRTRFLQIMSDGDIIVPGGSELAKSIWVPPLDPTRSGEVERTSGLHVYALIRQIMHRITDRLCRGVYHNRTLWAPTSGWINVDEVRAEMQGRIAQLCLEDFKYLARIAIAPVSQNLRVREEDIRARSLYPSDAYKFPYVPGVEDENGSCRVAIIDPSHPADDQPAQGHVGYTVEEDSDYSSEDQSPPGGENATDLLVDLFPDKDLESNINQDQSQHENILRQLIQSVSAAELVQRLRILDRSLVDPRHILARLFPGENTDDLVQGLRDFYVGLSIEEIIQACLAVSSRGTLIPQLRLLSQPAVAPSAGTQQYDTQSRPPKRPAPDDDTSSPRVTRRILSMPARRALGAGAYPMYERQQHPAQPSPWGEQGAGHAIRHKRSEEEMREELEEWLMDNVDLAEEQKKLDGKRRRL